MRISRSFLKETGLIAVPIAFQSLLQSSFSLIDQMMVGQLGQNIIAGTGIASKFSMIFTSLAIAGLSHSSAIMISQYLGQKDEKKASRGFWQNLMFCMSIGLLFTLLCQALSLQIAGLYTPEAAVRSVAASYLRIYSLSFPLVGLSTVCSVWLRCTNRAVSVTWSALAGAIANTFFNWLFIFELPAFRGQEANGAALASVISQAIMTLINAALVIRSRKENTLRPNVISGSMLFEGYGAFLILILPLIAGEMLWSLAENIYSMVYGQLSTEGFAAMTMTGPVQQAYFGILSGLGQAAAILIGRKLGEGDNGMAMMQAGWMMKLSFIFSCILGILVVLIAPLYVSIYQVSEETRHITIVLLILFAAFSLVKVQNMVLGGGILRSGGRTTLTFATDLIGTWAVGVPMALFTGSFLHLSIPAVYACVSCEEIVRYVISIVLYKKKVWMNQLG